MPTKTNFLDLVVNLFDGDKETQLLIKLNEDSSLSEIKDEIRNY